MPDETTATTESTTTETTTGAATTAGTSTEKMLTQTEVNRLVAQARREGKESASKQQVAAPAKEPAVTTEETAAGKVTKTARIEELEQRLEFRDMADEHEVPRELRTDLFDLYKAQKPTDPAEWFEKKSKQFAFGKAAPVKTEPAEAAKPAVMAPSGNVAPVGPIAGGANGIVDIFKLTVPQLEQLGPVGLKNEFEKILALGRAQSGAPPNPMHRVNKR